LEISNTVPVEIPSSGYPPGTGISEPQIQLVQAQPNGFSGPAYTAIPSTATIGTTPIAQASRIGTTVFATYEVVNADTSFADTFNIHFALAFNGSTPQSGTVLPLASLAPISTIGVAATNSEPVPRFVPTNFTPPHTPGDFDNNGVPDRIWQNDSTGQATVHYAGYTGVDLGSFNWLNSSVLPTWRIVAVADFNNDGIPDLVWQDSVTREVTVHYYSGSWNWLQSTPVPGWTVVAAADFNNDGVPDLVWQSDATRQVVVHYYGGSGGAVYQGWNWLQQTAVPGWHVVGAADFNRDGVPDLVWQNDTTGQVAVHYYGGAGGAVYQTSAPLNNNADAPSGWIVKAVSDVNGDGVPDLLWQNTTTRQVTVNYYGGPGGASIIGWNWISETAVPGWSIVH
ncbi:MAG: VCBS repeat-containing protein, partial [Bryobacteraceae bacterium]